MLISIRSLFLIIIFCGLNSNLNAQFIKDGIVSNYEEKLIFYQDLGFNTSPYVIKSNFLGSTTKLNYSHNFRLQYAIGFSYRWINLQLNLPLPVYTKALSRFGQNSCFGLQFNLNPKKIQMEFDLKYIKGFAIKNAYYFEDSLNELIPNIIKPNNTLFYFGTKAWYFGNNDFKLKYLNGVTGVYNQNIFSWFVNSAFRINSLKDPNGIIPIQLHTDTISKTKSIKLASSELAVVPGVSGVIKLNNFQLSIIGGIGGAIQIKQYKISDKNKTFMGITPRYELGLNIGYSKTNYFIFLTSDFENVSVVWNDLRYNQFYYALKLRMGYRFNRNSNQKNSGYLTINRSR
jgi:hypothetical protein